MRCPGTMPAEMLTWGPTSVSRPIQIHCSPKMAPGGKARQLPSPNAPNRLANTSPGPTAPWLDNQFQPTWTAALSQRRWTGRCTGGRTVGPTWAPADPDL